MRKTIILAALAAVLAGCSGRNNNEPIEASAKVLEDLPGSYTFKTTVDDSVRYSTAVVTQTAAGLYQISRITCTAP